jgi:hypothetical protein
MRKIVLNLAITLDGLLSRDLLENTIGAYTDHDYGMTEIMKSIDCNYLWVEKSYRVLLNYGAPYPGTDKLCHHQELKRRPPRHFKRSIRA